MVSARECGPSAAEKFWRAAARKAVFDWRFKFFMLKAQYHLRRKQDFQKIYRRGDYFFSPCLILRFIANSKNVSRFAFVISAKAAPKAVDRNLVKRRLSEIIRLNLGHLVPGLDVIIIAKKSLLAQKFLSQKGNLIYLLKRAKIWQE